MHLPKFECLVPNSVAEACSLLSEHQGQAVALAGGTDLVVRMRQRVATPKYVITLKSIADMDYIRDDGAGGLRIGALTSLHSLETSEAVIRHCGVVAQSANKVASPQVRNWATLGGNLCLDTRCWYYNKSFSWRQSRTPCYKTGGNVCHAVKGGKRCYALFCGDTAAALISLGAIAVIVGHGGNSVIPLENLYSGLGEAPINNLAPGQIVSEIQVPMPQPGSGSVYLKYGRHGLTKSIDFPLVGVAAMMRTRTDNEECVDAKLVLSGVASAPIRAETAETILCGNRITDKLLEAAADAAAKDVGPIVSRGTSVDYKRKMIVYAVREAIAAAWDKAQTAEQRSKDWRH